MSMKEKYALLKHQCVFTNLCFQLLSKVLAIKRKCLISNHDFGTKLFLYLWFGSYVQINAFLYIPLPPYPAQDSGS